MNECKPSLVTIAIIGMMGDTRQGERQGGMLVVVGYPTGAVLPPVEECAWVEYGPNRQYDRTHVDMTQDYALRLERDGWLEKCGGGVASTHYRLTEKSWALFTEFESWLSTYCTVREGKEVGR